MCDDDIHQGIAHEPGLSRRDFALTSGTAALVLASGGAAAADVVETDVDIKTPDGTADAALFRPSAKGKYPAVLIWTDILGLRPVFRQMGRRLAAQGYVVLVPNPFYRVRRAPIVDGAFDIAKPEDRAKVMPLAAALTPEGGASDAKAFVDFLDAQPQSDTGRKAGVQGYCMGGPLAFRTAAARADRIGAAATFHGGGLVTDKPSSPNLLIPSMKASFYCAVAANDDAKDPTAKTVLREDFAKARQPAEIVVYEGANHGWCVAGSPAYNAEAAERAWAKLTELYAKVLV